MAELTIEAHGRSYRIEDPGGLIGNPLQKGVPYERRALEYIYELSLEGLAVDVGAHIGNHTLWFAVVCGLRVVAFEPHAVPELRANIGRNDLWERVRVEPVALGDREGRARYRGEGTLQLDRGGIPVERLDAYELRVVSLLKVDVEGMEPQVLRGAQETIKRDRPQIFAEAWTPSAHKRVAEVLEPLGYEHVNTFGATPLEEWAP